MNMDSRKWEIVLDNSFVDDRANTYFGEGFFSDISLQRKATVGGIPLVLGGHIVLQNNVLNRRLSGLKVEFDTEQFVQTYKQKLVKAELSELLHEYGGQEAVGHKLLNGGTLALVKNKTQEAIDSFGSITKQRLASAAGKWEERLDSLKNAQLLLLDSLKHKGMEHMDSLLMPEDSLYKRRLSKMDSLRGDWEQKFEQTKARIADMAQWIAAQNQAIAGMWEPQQVLLFARTLPEILRSTSFGGDTTAQSKRDSIFCKKIGGADSLWAETTQKAAEASKQWEGLQQQIERKRLAWEQLDAPEHLQEYAGGSRYGSRLEKWMVHFRKLKVGNVNLSDSPLSFSSIQANGATFDWNGRMFHVSVGFGKEGPQNAPATAFLQSANRLGFGRRVAHIKAGVGNESGSFLDVSFAQITAQTPEAFMEGPANLGRKKNDLLGISGRYFLSKQVFLRFDGKVSNSDVLDSRITEDLVRNISESVSKPFENAAIEAMTGYRSKRGASIAEMGYSHIGGQYYTLGNPFLLTNRRDFKMRIKQRLLKQRLSLNVEARLNTGLDSTAGPSPRRNQYALDVAYRINRRGNRVWLKLQPVSFSQRIGNRLQTTSFNTVTSGCQFNGRMGNTRRWSSLFQVMNYRQETTASDTAFTAGRWYGTIQYSLVGTRWVGTFSSYCGVTEGAFKEGQLGININFVFKKFQIEYGAQVLRRPLSAKIMRGGSLGFSAKVRNNISFSFRGAYLWDKSTLKDNGLYLSSLVQWAF